jgi:hypothetical protein
LWAGDALIYVDIALARPYNRRKKSNTYSSIL